VNLCVNLKQDHTVQRRSCGRVPGGARLHDYWQQASKRGAANALRRVCGRNTVPVYTEVLVNLVEPPVVGWDPGYGKKTPGGAGGVGTHTGLAMHGATREFTAYRYNFDEKLLLPVEREAAGPGSQGAASSESAARSGRLRGCGR